MTDVGSDPCVSDCIMPSFLVVHVGQDCALRTADNIHARATIIRLARADGMTDAGPWCCDTIVGRYLMAEGDSVSSMLHLPDRCRPSRPCSPSSIAHGS